ncbi:MAG: bifunctional demethylmenaquinone methyltransferase/2-methoxy-6-polyprenyl-1,4-benzoquinol methylase UbiE [Dehalococcoidia bacterium]|nr:bifunctional demethylmenaquinone methyltransferase/2-methoxy-6-polyprenyl-1,4-benzoquinol methylase UbiE [Dehalococcoidia bacterium]
MAKVSSSNPLSVQQMFEKLAPRYDAANTFISLGRDKPWRIAAIKAINAPKNGTVLDIATGTGPVAFLWSTYGVKVVGLDFSHEMLRVADSKFDRNKSKVDFIGGDALKLPFPDNSFDGSLCAFGLRNMADRDLALAEMRRVVRPGSRVGILDFTSPTNPLVRAIFEQYMRRVIPFVGGRITGNPDSYRYLGSSIKNFMTPEDLAVHMKKVGLSSTKIRRLNMGSVMLCTGMK